MRGGVAAWSWKGKGQGGNKSKLGLLGEPAENCGITVAIKPLALSSSTEETHYFVAVYEVVFNLQSWSPNFWRCQQSSLTKPNQHNTTSPQINPNRFSHTI